MRYISRVSGRRHRQAATGLLAAVLLPGICSAQIEEFSINEKVAGSSGDICFNYQTPGGGADLTGWTLFSTGELSVDWGTNDDGICDSGAEPGNYTGGVSGAACINSVAAGPGLIDAYLCSPQIDFSMASAAIIGFRYNFQPWNFTGEDLFEVLIGTTDPSSASIGSYVTLFSRTDNAGYLFGTGAHESLEFDESLSAGYLCFRYRANNDFYAMLDNVNIGSDACGPSEIDIDLDGTPDDTDNCLDFPNDEQRDSDGDGFGNYCDPDLNNDCKINFVDLGMLKDSFFGEYSEDADLDGDGFVAFVDLGILKQKFLQSPGPSAQVTCDPP